MYVVDREKGMTSKDAVAELSNSTTKLETRSRPSALQEISARSDARDQCVTASTPEINCFPANGLEAHQSTV